MRKNLILILFVFFGSNLVAQREKTIIGDLGWKLSGAWGGWSYSIGSFNEDFSGYNGGIWALEFGKKLFIGGLHYQIDNAPIPTIQGTASKFSLNSNNLLIGFTPISYRPIHPIFGIAVGSGKLSAIGEDVRDRVFTFHPSAGVELNVLRWCHLDAQLGYRLVSDSDFTRYKDSDFSGLFGQINLKFGFSWGKYDTKD